LFAELLVEVQAVTGVLKLKLAPNEIRRDCAGRAYARQREDRRNWAFIEEHQPFR
jgi:hypothetical protein